MMKFTKEHAKQDNIEFFSSSDSFAVLQDYGTKQKHLLSVYDRGGKLLCRENGTTIMKPIADISLQGAELIAKARNALGYIA